MQPQPTTAPDPATDAAPDRPVLRPTLTELRLSAFKSHRGLNLRLAPVTLLAGPGGSGKSSVLEAMALLARLAAGDPLDEVVAAVVRGGPAACPPEHDDPDEEGRRGFRIGCTADGPAGPVRLDLAVQVEPELRVVGERLTAGGLELLVTALRDPERRSVQAAWHTAGNVPVTRAPLPDDRLATALLPLRVAGVTAGQRLVIAAAEQVLIALRAVFPVAPRPSRMRAPVRVEDGMLRPGCDNLSAVLNRTRGECRTRHAALVEAARAACSGPVEGVVVTHLPIPAHRPRPGTAAPPTVEGVLAALDRGPAGLTPLDRLGDSELRFLALSLVLLTGPGVLAMDQGEEVPAALRSMTVVADGLDVGLDPNQTRTVLTVARRAAEHGHVRLLATALDPDAVRVAGTTVVRLGCQTGD